MLGLCMMLIMSDTPSLGDNRKRLVNRHRWKVLDLWYRRIT
jgi:hypothetical protein